MSNSKNPWSSEATVKDIMSSLSGFIPRYVTWASAQTDAPMAYHVAAALAGMVAVYPPHVELKRNIGGGGNPCNLYIMVVGRQGIDRKTTSMKKILRMLAEVAPGRRSWNPGSEEAFCETVSEQAQQLIAWEDMATFFSKTQQRTGGNYATAIKMALLPLFDCSPMTRKTMKGTYVQEHPFVSCYGAINPALVAQHVEESDFENGLMSRFLVFWAAKERRIWDPTDGDPEEEAWLKNVLGNAVDIAEEDWGECLGIEDGINRDGINRKGIDPKTGKHDPALVGTYDKDLVGKYDADYDALDLWKKFGVALELTQAAGSSDRTCGPMARIPMLVERVSLIIEWSMGSGWPFRRQGASDIPGKPWYVSYRSMEAAIRICMMCYAGSLALATDSSGTEDMQNRRAVLKMMGEDWRPLKDIIRGAQLSKRKAMEAIETLITEDAIEAQAPSATTVASFGNMVPMPPKKGTSDANICYRVRPGTPVITGADIAARTHEDVAATLDKIIALGKHWDAKLKHQDDDIEAALAMPSDWEPPLLRVVEDAPEDDGAAQQSDVAQVHGAPQQNHAPNGMMQRNNSVSTAPPVVYVAERIEDDEAAIIGGLGDALDDTD